MTSARGSWLFTGLVAAALLCVARSAAPQFTPFPNDPHHILEGNWQSCLQRDGHYSERVYDHVVNGVGQFELHMGPRREFALFKGVQDEHRDHDSPENLLQPNSAWSWKRGAPSSSGKFPSFNLAFTVTLAGGSRMDCESWFILLEPLQKTS